MPFTNIQGQDSAVATLRNALTRDRLAHAYLFIGPAGVGKKLTALTLAQAALCINKPHEGCGACAGCASVAAGTHPDLTLVAPEAGKQSVGIEQVRDLQRLLGLRPVRGGKKIALLDDAHLLTAQAQSALLKIVEEPPGDALLILLTLNSATLSRPLLSRCQQVRFAALPVAVVEDLLVQDHGKDPAIAHALALYSRGSLGRALALDPEVFTEERRYVEEELQRLDGASFTTLSHLAEWLVADRVKKSAANTEPADGRPTGDRLELVLSWYEEVLRYALLGQDAVVRHQDCLPAVAQAAASLGRAGALRQLTLVYDTMQALGRNANRQLAVEDMLLQLVSPRLAW
ncbi:MAG: DNA polymerase III subunit [Deltaproteobacteria bacterium]|nr:DNA polymerase III subunit [Deltaproteobacteria bacterium]